MKSSSKQTASSSANMPSDHAQGRRQEAAFIASENRELASQQDNDERLRHLTAQQFGLSSRIGGVQRSLEKTIEEVKGDIEEKAAKELAIATEDIDKKVRDLKEDMNSKVLEARNKIIEPLAIFVALFTFISVGFQVFAQVKEYILWMPILAAVLGGLIIFAGLVIHASSVSADTKERRVYTGLIVILGAALFIGAGAYYYKAVDVLQSEDAKNCIMVVSNEQDADVDTTRYCKLRR